MKQYAIIGIGNFGRYLAVHLYSKGHAVLAVDRRASVIHDIKNSVSQAIVADAADKQALEEIGLEELDAVVVCIGDSSLSNSILATLNLHDIGVKRLLAKAISESHARILKKIGADEVFFPEKDQAVLLGQRLHNPHILDYLPFIEGYSMVQLAPPKSYIGKSLKDLNLINLYGVQVVAIKELVPERLNMIPTGSYVLKDSDIMIVLGPDGALDKLRKKAG
jgi:trk system potassium uptake protein TrkA